jgi:hypothetical protein
MNEFHSVSADDVDQYQSKDICRKKRIQRGVKYTDDFESASINFFIRSSNRHLPNKKQN